MIKTKIIKIEVESGVKNIVVTLRKYSLWNSFWFTNYMIVTMLPTDVWYKSSYVEKIKGSYSLLYTLFSKFEDKEALSFLRRYESKMKKRKKD